jgi:hypothetical protein
MVFLTLSFGKQSNVPKLNKFSKKIQKIRENAFDQEDEITIDVPTEKVNSRRKNNKKPIIIPVKREPLLTKALNAAKLLKGTLQETEEKLAQTLRTLHRSVKAYLSSDFESLLLRLTVPDDLQPPDKDITLYIATIKSFSSYRNMISEHNPYRVTLRKLWQKMVEQDSRTIIKSLCLFHFLIKFCDASDAKVYQKFFLKMSKEVHTKTKAKYFDSKYFKKNLKKTEDLSLSKSDNEGSSLELTSSFIENYQQYLWLRNQFFLSNFYEIKEINYQKKIHEISISV